MSSEILIVQYARYLLSVYLSYTGEDKMKERSAPSNSNSAFSSMQGQDNGHRVLTTFDYIPDYLEDVSAYAESDQVTFEAIGLLLMALLFWTILCFLIMSWIRKTYNCYEPRRIKQPEMTTQDLPKTSLLGWIPACFAVSEEEILKTSGLDAVVHIRQYYLAFRIFALFAVYGFCVLLPINFIGGEKIDSSLSDENASSLTDFEEWTMSNILEGSDRMWFHVLGMYILTIVAMYELRYEFQYFVALRHEYFISARPELRTVLVEKIPVEMRSKSQVTAYFDTMYNNSVYDTILFQDLTSLDRRVQERRSTLGWLERALYQRDRDGKEPEHRQCRNCCPQKINSVQCYRDQLAVDNDSVTKELLKAKTAAKRVDRNQPQIQSPYVKNIMELHQAVFANKKDKLAKTIDDEERGGNKNIEDEDDEDDDDDFEDLQEDEKKHGISQYVFGSFHAWINSFLSDVSDTSKDSTNAPGESSNPEKKSLVQVNSNQRKSKVMLPKCFVTFKTFSAVSWARQSVHASVPGTMLVSAAPEPNDILWDNMYVTRTSKLYRYVIIETVAILLLVFYIIPVTLIALLVSPEALTDRYEWIDNAYQSSIIMKGLIWLIQPCCLVLLMTTLPPIFYAFGMLEARYSRSDIVSSCFYRYYLFQVINVFLVTTIAGSVLSCIYQIISDPTAVFYLLGNSLPKVSGFFCEYMFLKAFGTLPLELTRLIQFFQSLFKRFATFHLTKREKMSEYLGCRDFMSPYWFNYGKYIPQDQLVILVAMTFAVIAPLILIPCLCFFAMAILVYRHQLLFVYETAFQTGGSFWPKIFRRYIFAMFLAQATLVGVLVLKSAEDQAYLVGLAMVMTAAYAVIMHEVYLPHGDNLPLEIAQSVDFQRDTGNRPIDGTEKYIQPSLREPCIVEPEINDGIDPTEIILENAAA